MPRYTTGELAGLGGVSVRTVQFYDQKDLLKPTELSEGGRRLYSEADLEKLRLICTLKTLGLSLGSIKGILEGEAPEQVLLLLLEEQEHQLEEELGERKQQLKAVREIKKEIKTTGKLPQNIISGIEQTMGERKKLRKTHGALLAVGIAMDIVEIGTLVLWIWKGIWQPFAIGMVFVVLLGAWAVWLYHKNTAYICPQCNTVFRPGIGKFIFSRHTPKTRKLTCPNGHKGYCVEVPADRLNQG